MKSKLLFIAPSFFGYYKSIIAELERMDYKVTYLIDRPFSSSILKLVSKYLPWLIYKYVEVNHFFDLRNKSHFDVILVINGQTISSNYLSKLEIKYKPTKKILYIWDSIKNRNNLLKNLIYFDHVFSFDPVDSVKYNFHFFPLFYTTSIDPSINFTTHHDFAFIGTMHSDRYILLKTIFESISNYNVYKYFYLQSRYVFYFKRLLDRNFSKAKLNDFHFSPLNYSQLIEVMSETKIIIDIENYSQNGLTIRSIESLGLNKKLITTNKDIANYDFYNPNNILIIDRDKIHIPKHFIHSEYMQPSNEIKMKYSLNSWLNHLLK